MQSYLVTVKEKRPISKNMVRITFTGESLRQFPTASPGSYIKLMFNQDGSPVVEPPYTGPHPRLRTYTIKNIDPQAAEITVDFVLHTHSQNEQQEKVDSSSPEPGLASNWAEKSKPGDQISFAGPGSSKSLTSEYDWVLFAGDLTALPSIENYLSLLPKHTKGFAFIQARELEDFRQLHKPEQLNIIWIPESESLVTAIEKQTLPEGMPAVWAACEFSEMRALRKLFYDDMQVPREQVYISSYWKKGRSEEQHKVEKRKDQKLLLKAG